MCNTCTYSFWNISACTTFPTGSCSSSACMAFFAWSCRRLPSSVWGHNQEFDKKPQTSFVTSCYLKDETLSALQNSFWGMRGTNLMWQPHIAGVPWERGINVSVTICNGSRKEKVGKREAQVQINVCIKHPTSSTGLGLHPEYSPTTDWERIKTINYLQGSTNNVPHHTKLLLNHFSG